MTRINDYFDKVFCINLKRRTDRWEHVLQECKKHKLELERFEAHDNVTIDGRLHGNAGCTASHRGLLELIRYHKWPRTLVLEDDFQVVVPDLNDAFSSMIGEVPEDWDMLYLGGGYGSMPQYRHSKHVIRIDRMMTTSSYGITPKMASKIAPYISGTAAIDCLYTQPFIQAQNQCYIFQPRMIVQYASMSDLTHEDSNNIVSMLDAGHENTLLDGKWLEGGDEGKWHAGMPGLKFRSAVNKDAIYSHDQTNGRPVIIGRSVFRILDIVDLPNHKPPWTQGEPCTFVLQPIDRKDANY